MLTYEAIFRYSLESKMFDGVPVYIKHRFQTGINQGFSQGVHVFFFFFVFNFSCLFWG